MGMSRNPQPKGFSACLKGIDVPVLMLHGDDDNLVGYAESVRVRDKFPEPATLIKIANCGHLSMEECPEEVCSEILSWMKTSVMECSDTPTKLSSQSQAPIIAEVGFPKPEATKPPTHPDLFDVDVSEGKIKEQVL